MRRYDKVARFSTIAFVRAGWLVRQKGIWRLTDDGPDAYRRFTDPEDFYREAGRLYREWKTAQPDEPPDEDTAEVDTAETASSTLEEAGEVPCEEIRSCLGDMKPHDFQNLAAALLEAMGYHVAWTAPKGKDRRVDIVAYSDPLGTTGRGPRVR